MYISKQIRWPQLYLLWCIHIYIYIGICIFLPLSLCICTGTVRFLGVSRYNFGFRFWFHWICTAEFECFDLVDFGGVACSVESIICHRLSASHCVFGIRNVESVYRLSARHSAFGMHVCIHDRQLDIWICTGIWVFLI